MSPPNGADDGELERTRNDGKQGHASDEPVIETENLTKRYGSDAAVEDLAYGRVRRDLRIPGAKRAGKSTTIDLLMDFVRPTEGSIRVLGMDPRADVVDVHQRVGILPDGFSVYENRTARDHLRLVIDTKGADDHPEAIRARRPRGCDRRRRRGYSRGMGQRLALAMALVGDPIC